MQEKQMKRFVSMAINKNERGFTLLSMLFCMTVLLITLPLLTYMVKVVTYESNYDEASIRQFYQFLRDDLMIATDYTVRSDRLTLVDIYGSKITFTKYKDQILRQVNQQGHDIYLRGIEVIKFTEIAYGVQVEITSQEGNIYEKAIIFYVGLDR